MLLPDRQTRMALGKHLPYLAGYWSSRRGPVEQTGTLLDLSGNGKHAIGVSGGYVTCGGGFQFDGLGDRFDAPAFTAGSVFSYATWFLYKGTALEFLFSNRAVSPTRRPFYCYMSSNTLYVAVQTASGSSFNVGQPLNTYTIYHVVVTIDTITRGQKIYINGELAESWAAPGETVLESPANLSIGGLPGFSTYSLTGWMDEAMVLTGTYFDANDVQALYQAQRHLFGV